MFSVESAVNSIRAMIKSTSRDVDMSFTNDAYSTGLDSHTPVLSAEMPACRINVIEFI